MTARELRNRVCTEKKYYPNQRAAQKGADWSFLKFETILKPYKCPFCIGWHIGHPNFDPQQAGLNPKNLGDHP